LYAPSPNGGIHGQDQAAFRGKPLLLVAATDTPKRATASSTLTCRCHGPGKPNTATPEHLFAAGYAACFGGALDFVAKQQKKDASKARVACAVSIGPRDGGGFGIATAMQIEDKSLAQADLAALVKEAHEKICPYSHATRGNVDVRFEVVGK
jgi:Ohr subfamily peroxiredoxin